MKHTTKKHENDSSKRNIHLKRKPEDGVKKKIKRRHTRYASTSESSSSSSSSTDSSSSTSSSSISSVSDHHRKYSKKKSIRRKKHKKDSSNSDSSSAEEKKLMKKRHKSKKSKKIKLSKELSNSCSTKVDENKKSHSIKKDKEGTHGDTLDIPLHLMEKSRLMAPMTRQEWDAKQAVVTRVYDESTGRHRLIKGDGEVIEEIVSKQQHKAINQQATKGDGDYFQNRLSKKI